MTRADEIQRDLGVKLSKSIEELFARDLDIAGKMLPVSNLADLLLHTAMGVNASVLSAVMQLRKRSGDPDELFDELAAALAQAIFSHKPQILDGLALIEAGRADEALRRYGADRAR